VDPVPVRSEAIGVLFPGEAAAGLGITRAEIERMIAAGKMRALPTGFTVTVPTSEVECVAWSDLDSDRLAAHVDHGCAVSEHRDSVRR
jgi:excisionase family DNA binding protein